MNGITFTEVTPNDPPTGKALLVAKLNPNAMKVSGKFTAMLGFLLDQHWSDPQITGMVVTSDGIVLVSNTKDSLFDEIVGELSDLKRNLRGVARAAGLPPYETRLLMHLAQTKIRGYH